MSEPVTFETLRAGAAMLAASGRTVEVRFSGSSMRPTIEPGRPVVLRCGAIPQRGDVVVVATGESLLVHRLIASGQGWILTRGDANPIPDPPLFAGERLDVGVIAGFADAEGIRELPGHRPRRLQSMITAGARGLIRIHPRAGALALPLLWALRRVLWLWPRRLLSR